MRVNSISLTLVVLAALSLGACGGAGEGEPGASADATPNEPRQATLVLDFVPNAVHAGIYRALAAGYYEDANIDLEIIEPSSTADTLKLIDSGKAEFGIAAGIDLANQIDLGRGAKGVMALVQRPLGGLITLEEAGIDDPAQLEGRSVGVTGVPSDAAVLDTVVADAGGDPSRIEVVTIGFNGVQALENGRVDAFTGFIAADGTQIEQDGFPVRSFALDDHGGPDYPGLVVLSTEEWIDEDTELLEGFVEATVRGYDDTLADPQRSLQDLAAENPALDPS
jgi:ABC-type nitrate/sulfonate/bicarbonate transport system substrate-binding protein